MSSIYPIKSMSDAELVATILNKKDVDDECVTFAKQAANLDVVREGGAATIKKADRVAAAVELGRRAVARRTPDIEKDYSCPEDVVELMEPIFLGSDKEMFYVLCLDSKNKLKKLVRAGIGIADATIVHPREIFKEAVKVSAVNIIVSHNHPSGEPDPSSADIRVTKRLVEAGEILGIKVLDHVVIGGGGQYISMAEEQMM